jgi:hypothetical protein
LPIVRTVDKVIRFLYFITSVGVLGFNKLISFVTDAEVFPVNTPLRSHVNRLP